MLLLTCNMHAMKSHHEEFVKGIAIHVWYPIMHGRLSLSVQGCCTLAKQYLLSAFVMPECTMACNLHRTASAYIQVDACLVIREQAG